MVVPLVAARWSGRGGCGGRRSPRRGCRCRRCRRWRRCGGCGGCPCRCRCRCRRRRWRRCGHGRVARISLRVGCGGDRVGCVLAGIRCGVLTELATGVAVDECRSRERRSDRSVVDQTGVLGHRCRTGQGRAGRGCRRRAGVSGCVCGRRRCGRRRCHDRQLGDGRFRIGRRGRNDRPPPVGEQRYVDDTEHVCPPTAAAAIVAPTSRYAGTTPSTEAAVATRRIGRADAPARPVSVSDPAVVVDAPSTMNSRSAPDTGTFGASAARARSDAIRPASCSGAPSTGSPSIIASIWASLSRRFAMSSPRTSKSLTGVRSDRRVSAPARETLDAGWPSPPRSASRGPRRSPRS